MIEVTGLKKRYGSFEAVRGVSFTVGAGRIVGLLGPNGAGKTSILKALTGFHRPSEGTVILNGIDVDEDPVAVKACVGYLPEGVPLYMDMTVGEYMSFVAEARKLPADGRMASIDKAVRSCGLAGMEDVLIDHLSKGYRQRVGLAQAIVHDPAILILDEPTTGLDPNQIIEIRSLIRSLGEKKTVILSTHILQEVEALCSEVLILNEGYIVAQGSAAKLAEEMKGDEKIECVLKGADARTIATLVNLKGLTVIGTDVVDSDRTNVSLRAATGQGDQAAETLFDWAVGAGAKILEMRRERPSLEDVFVRLTGEEAKR
ncbi:MAG: ABC transporter ATP-binding protein [Spirochaetales bacterium]|nr:MAG: ABC transporter ATP-binding protein [Spirochaetales bacterium]